MVIQRDLLVWHMPRVLPLSWGPVVTPVSEKHPVHRVVKKIAQKHTVVCEAKHYRSKTKDALTQGLWKEPCKLTGLLSLLPDKGNRTSCEDGPTMMLVPPLVLKETVRGGG